MKTNQLIFFGSLLVSLNLFSQCDLTNYLSAYRIPPASYPYFSVGSGVTVSVSTNVTNYSNFSYSCGGNLFAGSNPAWGLTMATHYIRLTFSAPVINLTVLINGTNQTETFYFAAGTGAITLSNYCTPDFTAAGASLTDNVAPAIGSIITLNNPAGSTTYTFTHNGLGAGSRMTLLDCFVPLVPLPVELTSLKAECVGKNMTKLSWKVSGEENKEKLSVERSSDGENWEEVKSVSDLTSYIDAQTDQHISYYRLKSTANDGSYKYSATVSGGNCRLENEVLIYPNPALSELVISGADLQTVTLTDPMGRELISKKSQGSNEVKLDLSELKSGIYIIKVREKNYKIFKE